MCLALTGMPGDPSDPGGPGGPCGPWSPALPYGSRSIRLVLDREASTIHSTCSVCVQSTLCQKASLWKWPWEIMQINVYTKSSITCLCSCGIGIYFQHERWMSLMWCNVNSSLYVQHCHLPSPPVVLEDPKVLLFLETLEDPGDVTVMVRDIWFVPVNNN